MIIIWCFFPSFFSCLSFFQGNERDWRRLCWWWLWWEKIEWFVRGFSLRRWWWWWWFFGWKMTRSKVFLLIDSITAGISLFESHLLLTWKYLISYPDQYQVIEKLVQEAGDACKGSIKGIVISSSSWKELKLWLWAFFPSVSLKRLRLPYSFYGRELIGPMLLLCFVFTTCSVVFHVQSIRLFL